MKSLLRKALGIGLCCSLLLPALPGQTDGENSPATPPPGINGGRSIVAAPAHANPIRVAIYKGPGSGDGGVDSVRDRAMQIPGATVTELGPDAIGTTDLKQFDVIVFSGGSGSAQSRAIGEAGRDNVRGYVENGGGYVGICAGAYLACAGFDWGIGLLNAETVSRKWKRGKGYVDVELSDDGREIFGPVKGTFKIRYANGPIIRPLHREGIPDYTVAAWFRSEVAENDSPVGAMINSPAAAYGAFGRGRVFVLSPHSENTPGLENVVPKALLWAAGSGTAK